MRAVTALLPILPLLIFATGVRGHSPWWGLLLWACMCIINLGEGTIEASYDSREAFLDR